MTIITAPNVRPGRDGENLRFPLQDEVFATWSTDAECGALISYQCASGAHLAALDMRLVLLFIADECWEDAIVTLITPTDTLVEHEGTTTCYDLHCVCDGGGSAECEWERSIAHSSISTAIGYLEEENEIAALVTLASLTQECFVALVDKVERPDKNHLLRYIRGLDNYAPGNREVLRLAYTAALMRGV